MEKISEKRSATFFLVKIITNKVVRKCYSTGTNHEKGTDRKCVECFKAQGLLDEEAGAVDDVTTEELLILYAQ